MISDAPKCRLWMIAEGHGVIPRSCPTCGTSPMCAHGYQMTKPEPVEQDDSIETMGAQVDRALGRPEERD